MQINITKKQLDILIKALEDGYLGCPEQDKLYQYLKSLRGNKGEERVYISSLYTEELDLDEIPF